MDDGSSSVKINVDGLSLSERAQHKNWKVRLEAYEAIELLFKQAEDNDKCFSEYGKTAHFDERVVYCSSIHLERRHF
jgi:hypothetical protein